MMRTIKKICDVKPYTLILQFNNDEVRKVDLKDDFREWGKSSDSKFKLLLKPSEFCKVKLNEEIESICWENGIDLCPDVLWEKGTALE
ncbi:MAG: DUF2442 domain-containing protein [Thermodesulfobacteriota bacterium]|nr:DUF2442 domain-containing protein [Thermodesulfobacteriota bacterium]